MIEVLVQLRIGGVDVGLVVATVIVAALVKEPVHEVAPNLLQALGSHCVAVAIVPVGRRLLGRDPVVRICDGGDDQKESLD